MIFHGSHPTYYRRSTLKTTIVEEGGFTPDTSFLAKEMKLAEKSHQEGQTLNLSLSRYILLIYTELTASESGITADQFLCLPPPSWMRTFNCEFEKTLFSSVSET